MSNKPGNKIVVGVLVPSIVAGHLVLLEEYCEPHCDWWHQPHAPHEAHSTSAISSLVAPSAFQTTSS
jgi:hypothetical protein